MAEGTTSQGPEGPPAGPQAGNGEAVSPIPGMHPKIHKVLAEHYDADFIEAQRDKYKTHEEFLNAAEEEVRRIEAIKAEGSKNPQTFSEEQVLANANLPEQERLLAAEKLLGSLTEEQKIALKRMHEVGMDRPGAGVYNYNQAEISEKARIGAEKTETGEEVFSREQRRKLFEAGLVGRIPPAEYKAFGFDPSLYSGDPILADIAELIEEIGIAGDANEGFVDRMINRAEGNSDQGRADRTLTRNLVRELSRLRVVAEHTPEPIIPPVLSDFERAQNTIMRLEAIQATRLTHLLTAAEQTDLLAARTERRILIIEVDATGEIENIKNQDYSLFREVRIDVPPSEKDSRLRALIAQQQQAQLRPLETEEYWAVLTRRGLDRSRHGGIIDYINQGNKALIRAAFDNPASPLYPDNGVSIIWNGFRPRDESGRLGPAATSGFDDIRKFIEAERKSRARYVGSRGNWLLPIEFIADGREELPDAVNDYALRLEKEIVSGTLDNVQNGLQERLGWAEKAMQAFMRHFNLDRSDPIVMWYSSKMNSIGEITKATVMVDAGKEGSKNYLQSMDSWGRGFKTEDETGKKTGDNFFDVLYFEQDTNCWMPVALDQLTRNHGEYWRYGSNRVPFPNNEERKAYQQRRDREITELMATWELRSIDDLLTNHPIFIDFKRELNVVDPALWPEYVEEARAWERFVTGVDREDQRRPDARIKFEHPLARKLTRAQFNGMFRPLQQGLRETAVEFDQRKEKRRKDAQWILKRAERLATALMVDTEAASARIYLKDAAGHRIQDAAGNYETKPFSVLVSEEVMKIVEKDKWKDDGHGHTISKPLGERKFKVFHVLNKLGLVDFPLYGAFDVGSDDTGRNDLVQHFLNEPELKAIIDAKIVAPNAKTTIVRWVEDERRIITLVERAVRRAKAIPTKDSRGNNVFADGTDYENFPGEHTPGGGIKYLKNDVLYPYYGISRDTVPINGMILAAYYGARTLFGEYGCEDEEGASFLDFVVWQKRRNELELKREGPAFRNPTGVTKWVGRVGAALEQSDLWTNNGTDPQHPDTGIVWAPLKSPYRLRMIQSVEMYVNKEGGAIQNPDDALTRMTPDGYSNYLSTVADVYSKIEKALIARRKLENIYGMAAGTAAFENTLTVNDLLDWMDYVPEEYREKKGYAIEAHLTLARFLATTNLFEDSTIFSSNDWNVIMRGGGQVKMLGTGTGPMKIPAGEGLYALLPDYLTKKITIGEGTDETGKRFEIDPIPLDEASHRIDPELIDLRKEGENYQKMYENAHVQKDRGRVLKN